MTDEYVETGGPTIPRTSLDTTAMRYLVTALILNLTFCSMCGTWLWVGPVVERYAGTEIVDTLDKAQWEQLPAPPEPLTRLTAAGVGMVTAETVSGGLLTCRLTSRVDNTCWNSIERVKPLPENTCNWRFQWQVPPPGQPVVDEISFAYCTYGFAGNYPALTTFTYVLTNSGEVWRWGVDENYMYETPGLDRLHMWTGAAACLVGLALPSVLAALINFGPLMRLVRRLLNG